MYIEITKTKCTKKSVQPPDTSCMSGPKRLRENASQNKVQKNIRQINIIEAIKKVPPSPKHRIQDTRNGHVIVLNEAGLEPIYVSKKVYYLFIIISNDGTTFKLGQIL